MAPDRPTSYSEVKKKRIDPYFSSKNDDNMTLAISVLQKAKIPKTAFRLVKVDTLRELCANHNITTTGPGARKDDYIKALLDFVSSLQR